MKKVILHGQAVPESKTKLKFGLGQIKAPSPHWAKKVFRIVLYTATGISVLSGIFTDIPEDYKVMIAKYSLQVVAAVHALTKLLGLEIDGPEEKP